ncbi:MAG: amino acid permease [Firmicutes bacterium]|nr:amino acid permease [Bacillota bacterium]
MENENLVLDSQDIVASDPVVAEGVQASNQGTAAPKKLYGFWVALSVVIGNTIGSGVFFKNETIAAAVGGNLWSGVLAWLMGGLITLVIAYIFSSIATKTPDVKGGTVGYAEKFVGKRYSKVLNWWLAFFQYPGYALVLAWVAADYSFQLVGVESKLWNTLWLTGIYVTLVFLINYLSPKIAGKFAISTVAIKLVPIVLMAVVGLILGLTRGTTAQNMSSGSQMVRPGNPFFIALIATMFAFDGTLDCLMLSGKIKDSKKNLPKAIMIGVVVIVIAYISYYVGIFGAAKTEDLADGGTLVAFTNIFGNFAGSALLVFVIISCLGLTNGMLMVDNEAIETTLPNLKKPQRDMIFVGTLLAWFAIWFVIGIALDFGIDEYIPIIFQAFMIPIIVCAVAKTKDLHWFKRFVVSSVAVLSILFLLTILIITTVAPNLI